MEAIKVTLLKGDGIGPEIIEQAEKVMRSVEKRYHLSFSTQEALIGAIAIDKTGTPLPEETISLCKESDAVLLGAVGDPKYDNDPTAKIRPEQGLLGIRKALGLYCNIRPIKIFDALLDKCPLKNEDLNSVDFVVFRELTGGIYFGEKGRSEDKNSAYDHCVYSRKEIERIAHHAFKTAMQRRRKVTLVDKANVLETSRLWREVLQQMTPLYPEVTLDFLFVDNAAMQIILNPAQFDVILTENMFGDIISDEGSVLSGSLGMLPSASVGDGTGLFEPVHGSFPEGAGKNIANPMATVLSLAMMLDYLELHEAANGVRKAVDTALNKGKATQDVLAESTLGTAEVGDYLAEFVLQA